MRRVTQIIRSIIRLPATAFAAIFGANAFDQMWTWFN